jgi:hypothetical protein
MLERDFGFRLVSALPSGSCLACTFFLVERCRSHDALALPKSDGYRFRVSALRAFKSPLILTGFVGWLNARKKHWKSAVRARP